MNTQPSRQISLDGGINFRDLGGYNTSTGQQVAWGKLYRCGHLANLTSNDQAKLAALGISNIHDFRRGSEQELFRNNVGDIQQFANYEMTLGSMGLLSEYGSKGEITPASTIKLMSELYAAAIENTRAGLNQFLRNLVNQSSPITVFHCMAGKDRTGLAAAVLLMILDVSDDDIVADYLLTQIYGETELITQYVLNALERKGITDIPGDSIRPYCSVDAQYINAFLNKLNDTYGCREKYLKHGLKLSDQDIALIKERYLAP